MRAMKPIGVAIALFAFVVAGLQSVPAEAQGRPVCGQEYTVLPGDTLSVISRDVYGQKRFQKLYLVNVDRIGPDPNRVEVGTRLRLPCDLAGAPVANLADYVPPSDEPEAVADGAVIITFNRFADPDFILNTGIIDPYLGQIERVTQGRVRFAAPVAADRDPTRQLDLVQSGQVDGAYIANDQLAAKNPLLQISMNPMIGGSARDTALALWRVQQKHFAKVELVAGIKLLGFVGAPPAQIWQVKPVGGQVALDRVAQARTFGVPYTSAAENTSAPAELFDKDGTGAADVVALGHGAASALGVWQDFRSVTEIDGGLYSPTFSVFISEEKWNQIAPADQAAIEAISGEALARRSAAWDRFEADQKRGMLAQGLTVLKADLDLMAELQERARFGWEMWIRQADKTGISGFTAINDFIEEIEELKKQPQG